MDKKKKKSLKVLQTKNCAIAFQIGLRLQPTPVQ